MNRPPDIERLLDDVLAEGSPPESGGGCLVAAVREAKSRKHRRITRRVAVALALTGLASILAWKGLPVSGTGPAGRPLAYQRVATHPLDASLVVHTTPFFGAVQRDRLPALVAVHTTAGHFRTLDDDQLLRLVSPHTAFLVGAGRGLEQLVFLNVADRDGFPVQ